MKLVSQFSDKEMFPMIKKFKMTVKLPVSGQALVVMGREEIILILLFVQNA
jgi:hypothetical protein